MMSSNCRTQNHHQFSAKVILWCSLLIVSCSVSKTRADYVLARAPQSSAALLSTVWGPFLEYVSSQVNARITLRVYKSRHEFEKELFAGIPDFAFMNPYYALLMSDRLGYTALVRDDSQILKGILVVPKTSSIRTVADLQHKSIAFPDVNAMGASLLTRAILTRTHGIVFNAIYVGPHENVYRAVLANQADAGSGVPQTLESEPSELQTELRVLFETPGYSSHPLIAHPRVPVQLRQEIVNVILSMNENEKGRKLLKGVKLTKPTRVDFERDYGKLRELHLEEFVVNTVEGQ